MSGNIASNMSRILGIELPFDFDTAVHDATHVRVTEANPQSYGEFPSSWMAVGFRFRACAEHDEQFTTVRQFRHSTSPDQKYIEERELFGFFVTGQAVLESYVYALYSVGAIVKPAHFPLSKVGHKRAIGPNDPTVERFELAFPNEDISEHLRSLVASPEYEEWSTVRNVLAHRLIPGRKEFSGNSPGGRYPTLWLLDIELDANTTADRRKWLAARVKELILAANDFTRKLWPQWA